MSEEEQQLVKRLIEAQKRQGDLERLRTVPEVHAADLEYEEWADEMFDYWATERNNEAS